MRIVIKLSLSLSLSGRQAQDTAAASEKRQFIRPASHPTRQFVSTTTAHQTSDWHRGRPENRVGPNWQLVSSQQRFGLCRCWIFKLRSVSSA